MVRAYCFAAIPACIRRSYDFGRLAPLGRLRHSLSGAAGRQPRLNRVAASGELQGPWSGIWNTGSRELRIFQHSWLPRADRLLLVPLRVPGPGKLPQAHQQ
jgi:hypothetical protein